MKQYLWQIAGTGLEVLAGSVRIMADAGYLLKEGWHRRNRSRMNPSP